MTYNIILSLKIIENLFVQSPEFLNHYLKTQYRFKNINKTYERAFQT